MLFVVYFTASHEEDGHKKSKITHTETMRDYFEHKGFPLKREAVEKI